MAKKNLADRIGEVIAPLDDRRRLAVTRAIMIAEANSGTLTQYQFGMCVIENALDDGQDVMDLSDATNRRLAEIAYGGY